MNQIRVKKQTKSSSQYLRGSANPTWKTIITPCIKKYPSIFINSFPQIDIGYESQVQHHIQHNAL